jgi:hypothetical protein
MVPNVPGPPRNSHGRGPEMIRETGCHLLDGVGGCGRDPRPDAAPKTRSWIPEHEPRTGGGRSGYTDSGPASLQPSRVELHHRLDEAGLYRLGGGSSWELLPVLAKFGSAT